LAMSNAGAVLLHLIDGTSGDPAGDLVTIIHELEQYGGELADKPASPC